MWRKATYYLVLGAGFAFSTPYGPAAAATLIYDATLSGATEIPPTGSPGTGFATVTINTVADTMRVQESFSGLETAMSTGTTASHIHCCGVQPMNVGIATTTPTFPNFPLGVFSGTYDMTFDMTLASSYNPGFITAEGGTVSGAFAALLTGLERFSVGLNRGIP
jgi:hypothetical protein